MGLAKNEMMRLEDLQNQGEAVLAKAGALKPCPAHDDVMLDQEDGDAASKAYAIGTNMVKAGEVDGSREEFMDAIKAAIDNSASECPFCARAYADD